jgi:methyl-accepting chemotaxis protein
MSIRSKILVPMICVTVACALVIGIMCIRDLHVAAEDAQRDAVIVASDVSKAFIDQEWKDAEHISQLTAENHDVIEALAALKANQGDAERKRLVEAASHMAKIGSVDFMSITDENGIVVARTHSAKIGDNVSAMPSIKAALGGNRFTTIELGTTVSMSLCSGSPIYFSGKLIGALSTGFRFDKSDFVDQMKKISKTEVTLFMGDTRLSTTIVNDKGERSVGTKAEESISKTVLAGSEYIGKATVAGKKMYTIWTPLREAEGTVIGMLFEGLDIRAFEARQRKMVTGMIAVVLALCTVAVFAALKIANAIAKPIKELSMEAGKLALGDMDISLKVEASHDSKDETRQLAASFADLIDANREQERLFGFIAKGDLTHEASPRSDKDTLTFAMRDMMESTKKEIGVMERMADGDLRVDLAPRCERDSLGLAIQKMLANLNAAMEDIHTAATHMSGASAEISGGAQSLAESASEQASSLDVVSSSLEEMSSMTKQNADSSNQGKTLVASVAESLNDADAAMKRMADAIQDIKTSSDNTAKILKTIDDIAFQTNLLALNAAVEAARAGEAGKGFAVVAEEVRNLAMRSADAAKNTAGMIEESVKSAEEGVQITDDVAKFLRLTIERAEKVGEIIAEIAAANNEQAQGIEQVNTAVVQINSAIQQNAANSEESASAAEELSSQASELDDLVKRFKLRQPTGGLRAGKTFELELEAA